MAAATVYDAGKDALLSVGKDAAEATVKVVRHRHGQEAGEAAQDGADALVGAGETILNVASLTPVNVGKGLAKTTAKKVITTKPKKRSEAVLGKK